MRKRADTFQLRNRVNVGRVLPFSGRLTQPESSALFQAKPYLITSNSRRAGGQGCRVATWPQGLNRFSSPTQCNRSPGRTEVDKTQAARPLIIGKYPLPFLATFTEGKKEIGKVERKRREREPRRQSLHDGRTTPFHLARAPRTPQTIPARPKASKGEGPKAKKATWYEKARQYLA